jgi:CubicO group peptidase (beta-lactamase class C family)
MKKVILLAFLILLQSLKASAYHMGFKQHFGASYKVPGNSNYQKLTTDLQESELSKTVQQSLDDRSFTGLVSYILFENNKIVINKKNWDDEITKNQGLLRSNSVGKSLASYVVGHAICKGYIDNINIKLNDWFVIKDTLYADNTLLQVLNMTSGDHRLIGQRHYSGDNYIKGDRSKVTNQTLVWDSMKLYFNGTRKEEKNSPYNYSAMSTYVAINYAIYKVGGQSYYQKLLKEIFTNHVKVKDDIHFGKISSSARDVKYGSSRYTFFATAEDYLRIANTIIQDYNSDTCIGNYLRTSYEKRISKELDYKLKSIDSDQYTRSYGSQFHFDLFGLEKRIIFVMNGFAGQEILMDMENKRVIIINSIDQHYDWKKIVYEVISRN